MATKRPPSLLRILRHIAFIATVLGGLPLFSIANFYSTALPTEGIVVDWASSDEAFSTGRAPVIAFVDYRNLKQLAAPQSAAGTGGDRMGDKIRIRYNPHNPKVFRIDTLMGMWATGVIKLLYGLVPFLFLSFLISATGTKTRMRKREEKRKSTLGVKHLVDHTQNMTDTDKPVVRRMR